MEPVLHHSFDENPQVPAPQTRAAIVSSQPTAGGVQQKFNPSKNIRFPPRKFGKNWR